MMFKLFGWLDRHVGVIALCLVAFLLGAVVQAVSAPTQPSECADEAPVKPQNTTQDVVVEKASEPQYVGLASWYAKGLPEPYTKPTAASRDLPRYSMARVINTENGKSVDVYINDYGPNAEIHPERIIDLSSYAFQQIAPLERGTVTVKVIPL